MAKKKNPKFGKLPRLYKFILNPYPDQRISRCPFCENKTGQRKVPLFIHVDPDFPIALNYTCRYCKKCDLLIAHKLEIERLLTDTFVQLGPEAIGNKYIIIGTVEKKSWREGLREPVEIAETRSQTHDFKMAYSELRMTAPGWYAPDQEPVVMEPPPSNDWVKRDK